MDAVLFVPQAGGGSGDSSVRSYATFADFPATGMEGIIYIDESTADMYLWDGSVYELQGGGSPDPFATVAYVVLAADVSYSLGQFFDTNIAGLTVPVEAGKSYIIDILLRVTNPTAFANFRVKPYFPSGTNLYGSVNSAGAASEHQTLAEPSTSPSSIGIYTSSQAGDFSLCDATISVDVTTTGVIGINVQQASPGTTTLTFKAGSLLRVMEIPT